MSDQQPTEDTNNSPWVIVYLFGALGLFVLILVLVGLVILAVRLPSRPYFLGVSDGHPPHPDHPQPPPAAHRV